MYRSELHRFPPKGPVNQAKGTAVAVEKGQKRKSKATALKPKPAKETVRMKLELEVEVTPDKIVEMLEALEEFQQNVLSPRKPIMWQQMKKKMKESASAGT